jgi:transcriptional regulator with XRE-family HTH domain
VLTTQPKESKNMKTGDLVKKLMEQKGLTYIALLAKTGLALTTLRRIVVLGQVTPRSAARLAAALGVPAEDFRPADCRGQANAPMRRG